MSSHVIPCYFSCEIDLFCRILKICWRSEIWLFYFAKYDAFRLLKVVERTSKLLLWQGRAVCGNLKKLRLMLLLPRSKQRKPLLRLQRRLLPRKHDCQFFLDMILSKFISWTCYIPFWSLNLHHELPLKVVFIVTILLLECHWNIQNCPMLNLYSYTWSIFNLKVWHAILIS